MEEDKIKEGDETSPEIPESIESESELTSTLPDQQVKHMLSELEVLMLQKGGGRGIDFSRLTDNQIDAVIAIMSKNEDNAYKYHTAKLDANKEVTLAKIKANTLSLRSFRNIIIFVLLIVAVLTVIILLFKEQFFSEWLAFITGLGAGTGLASFAQKQKSERDKKNFSLDSGEKNS